MVESILSLFLYFYFNYILFIYNKISMKIVIKYEFSQQTLILNTGRISNVFIDEIFIE